MIRFKQLLIRTYPGVIARRPQADEAISTGSIPSRLPRRFAPRNDNFSLGTWVVAPILFFFVAVLKPGPVWGRVFLHQEEALRIAFSSGTVVERKNLYLTTEQINTIEKAARSKMDSSLVTYYVGKSSSGISGVVFFNSHTVRTMPETLMVVVNPNGSLRSVEILAFYEPDDYLPPKKWLGLFENKKLDDDLWVKRGIRNVTGATLTTQAITETVRRLLAVYDVGLKPTTKGSK